MHSALWVSKTGLSAQDKQLTTISNNLSNAATVGFKRDRGVFEDLLYRIEKQPGGASSEVSDHPTGLQLGSGVRLSATKKEFTQGSLQITTQPFDVAINGRGFLQVEMPDGSTSYTRNGQLGLNADSQLVTSNGFLISPTITVPTDLKNLTIGKDGVVTAVPAGQAEPVQLGTIQLADFVNPAGLEAIGDNLFRESAASGTPQSLTPGTEGAGQLEQGSLENSNVDVVEELVNMITTQRTYEMNSKVISTADQMLQYVSQNL
jgi:flagellar basal-body rod protein FlgG